MYNKMKDYYTKEYPKMCERDIILLCQWVKNFERFPNRPHPILWIVKRKKSDFLSDLFLLRSFKKYIPCSREGLKDMFGLRHLVGSDLILVSDCKDPMFPSDPLLHDLIRGGYHQIQVPQEEDYQAYLKCAVIVVSGLLPEVTPEQVLVIDLGD